MRRVEEIRDVKGLEDAIIRQGCKYALYVLRIGLESGLRVSDILRYRYNPETPVWALYELKTGKSKKVEFSRKLYRELNEYAKERRIREGELLFQSKKDKKKSVSRTQLWRVFKRAGKESGQIGIGLHSMRRTYARELYRETLSVGIVQCELNHERIETTLRYLFDFDKI